LGLLRELFGGGVNGMDMYNVMKYFNNLTKIAENKDVAVGFVI